MLAKFRRFEFEAVDGVIRSFYGCSVVGAIEFEERLLELQRSLQDQSVDADAEHLYRTDKWIQYLVNRLLELNGIKPAWCNWDMVSQMLLGRTVDGEIVEGYLVTLNKPEQPKKGGKGEGVTFTKAGLIAAIATHCDGLEEAYRIANTVPAHELLAVLEQKVELGKSPEVRAKEAEDANFEEWKQKKLKAQRKKMAS